MRFLEKVWRMWEIIDTLNLFWAKKKNKLFGIWWYLQRYCRRCWNKIWHFELWNRWPLSMGKNKKVIGLIKDELGGQIMKKFVGLSLKSYSYLKDNND